MSLHFSAPFLSSSLSSLSLLSSLLPLPSHPTLPPLQIVDLGEHRRNPDTKNNAFS